MAITGDQVAASADELLQELRRYGIDHATPAGRPRALDIIAALEADPSLTLADILPPEEPAAPMPPTLTGRENQPRPQAPAEFPPMLELPRLPSQVPVADSGSSRTPVPTHRGQRSGDRGQLLTNVQA